MILGKAEQKDDIRCRGVITVYLSLIMMLYLSVIMVSLESARTAILWTSTQRYGDMAAEMVFSGYVKPLAQRYGIFVLDTGGKDGEKTWFEKYLRMNLEKTEDTRQRPFAMYAGVSEVNVTGKTTLKSHGWVMFYNEIRRAELYRLGEDGLKRKLYSQKKKNTSAAADLAKRYENELEGAGEAADQAAAESREAAEVEKESENQEESEQNDAAEKAEDPRPGIGRWLKGGLLKVVLSGKKVSGKKIDISSCTYKTGKSPCLKFNKNFGDYQEAGGSVGDKDTEKVLDGRDSAKSVSELLEEDAGAAAKNTLLNIYVLDRFADYSGKGKEKRVLDYEVEYILYGRNSDRKNLEDTMTSLCSLRTVLNLAYLWADSGKTAQLGKMASALASAAMPALGELIRLLLMTCWASAEAAVDCAALADGKRVPLWKTRASWNLTLEQLSKIAKKGSKASDFVRDGSHGLSYRQYLMMLLSVTSRNKKIMRMLQLMEKNVRLTPGYSNFSFRNCITGAEFTFDIQITSRFYGSGAGRKEQMTVQYSY